jgi:hypothetical protein
MSNKCSVVLAIAAFSIVALASAWAAADSVGVFPPGCNTYTLNSTSGTAGLQIGEYVQTLGGDPFNLTVTGTANAVPQSFVYQGTTYAGSSTVAPTGTTAGYWRTDIGSNYIVATAPSSTYSVGIGSINYNMPNNQFIGPAVVTGSSTTAPVSNGFAALPAAIEACSNAGLYNGSLGLTSSWVTSGTYTVSGSPQPVIGYVGIGFVDSASLAGATSNETSTGTFGSYNNNNVPLNSLLIAPAYKGDDDLAGSVSLDGLYAWQTGYAIVLAHPLNSANPWTNYITPDQLWREGDYDNEGTINLDGLYAWQTAYAGEINHVLPPLPTSAGLIGSAVAGPDISPALGGPAPVPEPSTFVLLAAAAALYGLARWRRRRP